MSEHTGFQNVSKLGRQKRCVQPIKGNHDIELQRIHSGESISVKDSCIQGASGSDDMNISKHDTLRSSRRSPSPVHALLRAQSQTQSPRSSPCQLQHRTTNGSPLPLHQSGRMQSPSHGSHSLTYGKRTSSPQLLNNVNVNRITSPTMLAMSSGTQRKESPVPMVSCETHSVKNNHCHLGLSKGGNNKSPQLILHAKSFSQSQPGGKNSPSLSSVSIHSPHSAFNKPKSGKPSLCSTQPQSPVQMTKCLRNSTGKVLSTKSHRANSKSPIMQHHLSHSSRARSNSPKVMGRIVQPHSLAVSGGKPVSAGNVISSFTKTKAFSRNNLSRQSHAESTTEYREYQYRTHSVSPVLQHHDGGGQRQDPTTRDLEFLMGGANGNPNNSFKPDDITSSGLGSDHDLDKKKSDKYGKIENMAMTTTSVTTSPTLSFNDQRQLRPSSGGLVSSGRKTPNMFLSPTVDNSSPFHSNSKVIKGKFQEPGTQTRQQQRESISSACEDNESLLPNAKQEEEKCHGRHGVSVRPHQRCRASSWDSPATLMRRRKARAYMSKSSSSNMQLHLHAKQLKHQQQQLGMKLNQQQFGQNTVAVHGQTLNSASLLHQQLNKNNGRVGIEQETFAEKPFDNPLEVINGMSLEDVFQLERVLHSYKEQLLRQRVYSTPDTVNQGTRIPQIVSGNGTIGYSELESFDTEANESIDNVIGSTCHPPERCQSGNCFFDEVDEGVIGTMEFEEYEPTYQFQPDQLQSGVRAPNFKMFYSAEPEHQVNGTPSMEEDTTDTTTSLSASMSSKQSTRERPRSLSQSPGNISFVDRVARHFEHLKLKPSYSKSITKYAHTSLKERNPRQHDNVEAAMALDLMSSPRSAFSRAPVISHAT